MRRKHRVEFDIFLKRRKARIAAAAAAAAASQNQASVQQQQQLQQQSYLAHQQYFQAQQQAAMAAAQLMAQQQQQQYGSGGPRLPGPGMMQVQQPPQQGNNDQFQQHLARYAAMAQLALQQQQQQQNYPMQQQQGQPGPNLTLPLGLSVNYQEHLQNMVNYGGGGEVGGHSVSPSPSISPGPVAMSPVPYNEHSNSTGQQISTQPEGHTTNVVMDSPEISAKSGPGSSPDTPTRNLGGGGGGQIMEMQSGGGGGSPYGFVSSPYGAFRPVISASNPSNQMPQYHHPAAFASYYLQPHHTFMGLLK